MGQLNKDFVESMLKLTENGKLAPITVWEMRQLADAWLALHGHKTWPGMPCKCARPEDVTISQEVVDFLHGSAPLEGVWFGDEHPTALGRFWWRRRLPDASTPQEER